MNWETILTAAVAALSVAVAWLGVRVNRPKVQAETEALRVDTSLKLVKALEARVSILEIEVHELHEGIELLLLQLREANVPPVWRPR